MADVPKNNVHVNLVKCLLSEVWFLIFLQLTAGRSYVKAVPRHHSTGISVLLWFSFW